jgi:NAD(P)-dependent dehydrogenase (short-subunit alcohol dehydrogenase family)
MTAVDDMQPGFAGQVGLVTGGAGGIGRAVASLLTGRGATVILADRDEAKTIAAARDFGESAHPIVTDITDEDAVDSMVAGIVRDFGRLDFAVNNAGIGGVPQRFIDTSLETWSRALSVNLTGTFLCMRAELRAMTDAAAGAIVNVSSASAYRPPTGIPAYVASKNGILGLTRSAALEFAATGIRVNTVVPGSIDTPMLRATMGDDPETIRSVTSRWAAGRMGTPEEVACAIAWLCSHEASFVNGLSLIVDGGMLSL